MHPLNIMRLQAGLVIDPSLEKTKTVTEAREVPRKRSDLVAKSPETIKAHVVGLTKAITHLENAVKALERIPAHDFMGDIPHYINEIEELISSDSGQAGMKSLLTAYQKDLSKSEPLAAGNAVAEGELKEMMDYENEEENKDSRFNTANDFKTGEKVLYDNGIWVVHVADAKADLVGIVPASMSHASKEEKDRAMQQVKRDKLRKPSEEECEVMAMHTPAMEAAVTESTYNYTPSNVESFEDTDEDPANVVAQAPGQWKNSLNPSVVKNEYTTQLDNRGDQSMDDYANKVKVPFKVKTELKAAIAAFERDAAKHHAGQSAEETKQFYLDAAEAFKELLGMLNGGTIMDVKKAQVYASSLMGPMLHKLPDVVWEFIVNGGQKRSLKDYMNPVKKFPIEGPRNS